MNAISKFLPLVVCAFFTATPPAMAQQEAKWNNMTRQGWEKLYDAYGQEWLDHVNRLGPAAVKKLAQDPRCDRLYNADYSLYLSQPPNVVVFYGDCYNKARVTISENDLNGATAQGGKTFVILLSAAFLYFLFALLFLNKKRVV